MKIRAYAKINLALDVVRRREDGYHDLEMIMAPLGLHDLIIINPIEEGIELTANTFRVPTDERNIMYKAAKLMIERFSIEKGVSMHVYKHIPSQAGLGGGSADGAAVIRAMNQMFDLHLSLKDMAAIGKEIGADIPFCIYNQISYVQGIGEIIQPIQTDFNSHILLVKPNKGVSTKKSFQSLDMNHCIHPDIKHMIDGLEKNDYKTIIDSLGNTLEEPSIKFVEDIQHIKDDMKKFGFEGILMSGSGSCVFGLTRNQDIFKEAIPYFQSKYPFVRRTNILNQ